MKKIDKLKLLEIIQKVKLENGFQGKNFEIFVLNEIMNLPYLKKEFTMDLYRGMDKSKPFMLEHKRSNLSFHFDSEKNEFVSEINLNGMGDKVNTQDKTNMIRNVVKLLENSENYNYFDINFEKYIDLKDKNQLKDLFDLMDKFEFLNFFYEYHSLKTSENDYSHSHNFLHELNLLLPFNYKDINFEIINKIKEFVMCDENFLNKRSFLELKKLENFYNKTDDEDELTYIKRLNLFNNEFFKENTFTGFMLDKSLSMKETAIKMFEKNYEEFRQNTLSKIENHAYLKSKEEMTLNMPIQKAIEEVIREYPFLKNECIKNISINFEKSKFTNIEKEAGSEVLNNNSSVNKLGLIDDRTYADLYNLNTWTNAFIEDHPNKCDKVTFRLEDDMNVLIQYIFKEKDYYGVKVLTPKLGYIKPHTSKEDFNESLKLFCDYAYANNCIIDYGKEIDMDIVFYDLQDFLDKNYKDKIIYIDDTHDAEERFNYILLLKKEFDSKINHEDLYNLHKKLIEQRYNEDLKDIYNDFTNEISKKYKFKNKKIEP